MTFANARTVFPLVLANNGQFTVLTAGTKANRIVSLIAGMWQRQLCWLTKPNIIVLMYLNESVCENKIQYLYSAIITRCSGALQYNNNNSIEKLKHYNI